MKNLVDRTRRRVELRCSPYPIQ